MGIITPEAVLLELQPAGIGTRILARLIDGAIQLVLVWIGWLGLAFVGGPGIVSAATVNIVGLSWIFAVLLVLPAAIEAQWRGRSPGKAMLGLQVVTVDGGPIGVGAAAIRGLLQLVDVYAFGIGVFPMLGTRRSQRFGDLLAGTFVLSDRFDAPTSVPVAFIPPSGTEGWIATADVSRMGPEHYALLRRYLLRVGELTPEARLALAVDLADRTRRLVTPEPWPWFSAELYLNCVASAYQLHQGGLPVTLVPAAVGSLGRWAPQLRPSAPKP